MQDFLYDCTLHAKEHLGYPTFNADTPIGRQLPKIKEELKSTSAEF